MRALCVIAFAVVIAVVCGYDCKTDEDCIAYAIYYCNHVDDRVCHGQSHCECTTGSTGQSCLQETDCTCPPNHHGHCINEECHCVDDTVDHDHDHDHHA